MMNCRLSVPAVCMLASISVLQGAQFERQYVIPVSTGSNSNPGEYPGESVRGELRSTLHQEIRMHLQNLTLNTTQGQESIGMVSFQVLNQLCYVRACTYINDAYAFR